MRLGMSLPNDLGDGRPFTGDALADAARNIEAAGFDSVWAFDAVGRGFMTADPLVSLSVAAAVTRRVELGTGVLQVPLRHPVALARQVLTTQLASGNRLLFGVGAGSTQADFTALDVDFTARFRLLDQSLATMKKLWAGETVNGARIGPIWPAVLGGPPVMIGSWAGGRWIERAAREFDGWVGSGARSTWGLLATGIARFRSLGGRRAVATNVVVRLGDETSPDGPDDPCDLRCTRAVAAARLRRLQDMGFDDVVLVSREVGLEPLRELRALA